MTSTDELRRILDERGVEWKEHRHMMPGSMAIQRETLWGQPVDSTSGKPISHVYHYRATEMGDGRLFLEAQLIAPAQAIAATVGRGTCHDAAGKQMAFFACSACGATIERKHPRFCYGCGRKVVDE